MKRKSASLKKVFVVEGSPAYAGMLVKILGNESGLAVCGQAGSAKEALRVIPRLKPDLVLADVSLPGADGLDLIKRLHSKYSETKLLILCASREQSYVAKMLRAGGDGYVIKQPDPEEIVDAILDVLDGHIYVSENIMANVAGLAHASPPCSGPACLIDRAGRKPRGPVFEQGALTLVRSWH
jgi:DNA-binding NarL/FixJ family response regulator